MRQSHSNNMRDYKAHELYPNSKTLSSTQLLDYAQDPHKFHVRWMLGGDSAKSKAMLFGSAFSEAYADRSWDYHSFCLQHGIPKRLIQLLGKVLPLFPELKKRECEFEMRVKYRGWTIRVTLDGFISKELIVIENKTGQLMWTQEVADNTLQITLQQWAVWKKKGQKPKKHYVNWVDTSTRATKLIHTFETKRTVTQLKAFERGFLDLIIDGLEAGNFTQPVKLWDI